MPQSLTTAPNFRDLGGLPTADGRIVRPGLVFRSEALLEPIDADAAAIIAYGIVLVCDLRSDSERNHAPNDWWAAQGVELLDLDVMAAIEACDGPWLRLRSDRTTAGAIAAMEATYTALPAAALVHLAAIVDRIIAGNLPLLIHCTAGKDRTGFVSAMLLAALGVDHATILADYLDSDGRWTPQVREHTRQMVADQIAEGSRQVSTSLPFAFVFRFNVPVGFFEVRAIKWSRSMTLVPNAPRATGLATVMSCV